MQAADCKYVSRPSPDRLRQMAETSVDPVIRSALQELAAAYEDERREGPAK